MGLVDVDAGLDALAFGDTVVVFNLSPAMLSAWRSQGCLLDVATNDGESAEGSRRKLRLRLK